MENPVNPGENGQLPVAILGSSSFDVTRIDASSILLGSASLSTRGKAEKLAYSFEDVNGDGFMDMITFFSVPDLALTSSDTGLTLTAVLNDGHTNYWIGYYYNCTLEHCFKPEDLLY